MGLDNLENKKTLNIVYAALFSALIFAVTHFIIIPLPFGYLNFGDCIILTSAVIIGTKYSVLAAAVGAALADILSGYSVYAPATIIIKSLMVISFVAVTNINKNNKPIIKFIFLIIGAVTSEIIMVCGYFITEIILYSLEGAVAALFGNMMQGIASVIGSVVIITALRKLKLVNRIK